MSWWTDLVDALLGRHPPPPPPPPPQVRTLAIVVTQGGKPVIGAAAVLRDGDRRVTGVTNADGYFAGQLNAVPFCTVDLEAAGYRPFVADFDIPTGNHDLLITDRLTPIVAPRPIPPRPTVTNLQTVRACIGDLVDSRGRLILPSFVLTEPKPMRDEWYARTKAAGATHYPVALKYFYHDHPAYVGKDWRGDMRGWVQGVTEVIDQGFWLDFFWTQGDGDFERDPDAESRRFIDPASPTYGPRLLEAASEACVAEGLPDVSDYGNHLYGWEPHPLSVEQCIPVLRKAIGPSRQVVLHLQQGYGNPTGEGGNFWRGPVGQMIDQFFFQATVAEPGLFDEFGQPSWQDNAIEILNRMLPRGFPLPGCQGHRWRDRDSQQVRVHPGVALGPDWFEGAPRRAVLCLWEIVAYFLIQKRGGITAADLAFVQETAQRARRLGFTHFGNGVPR